MSYAQPRTKKISILSIPIGCATVDCGRRGICNEHDAPFMRTLLLTGSSDRPLAPLRLAAEQITGGPGFADARSIDDRWLLMRTPRGNYDLAEVLARIPAHQYPEAIVYFLESGWSDAPRNLRCFAGTKILLLADDLKREPDLSDVFRYVGCESFDRVMFRKDLAQLKRFLAGVAPGFFASLHSTDWPNENLSPQVRAV